jgi:hypothetical protein
MGDPATRADKLQGLRNAMISWGEIDADLQALLKAKLAAEYSGADGKPIVMRFRTSTNSEDLQGFPCAGCYESHQGDPAKWDSVLTAIRQAYSSAWLFRTFEERSYYQVDHKSLGMGLLVHHHFATETANGVAVTVNPFDTTGLDPAFFVNVEIGGAVSVVHMPPGVATDQFLYYFNQAGQSISYLAHSNILPAGMATVLTDSQVYQLGAALNAMEHLFYGAYGQPSNWHGVAVEFKFDPADSLGNPGNGPSTVWIKEARPYPGRGNDVNAAVSEG